MDTETRWSDGDGDIAVHTLRLGVACYVVFDASGRVRSRVVFRFTRVREFWRWVEEHTYPGTRTYLVSHNVHFDLKVLGAFRALKRQKWRLTKLLLNGAASIIDFRKEKRSIRVVDNLNWFKVSLEKLGEEIGISKLTMPHVNATNKEWFVYCERDVQVLVAAWEKWIGFVREADLGCFAATLAGQSFNAFRHRFMPHAIYIHTRERVLENERQAYHGGRVECFHLGEAPRGRYYYLDINSMYPAVMLTGEYPTRYVKSVVSPSLSLVRQAGDRYCLLGEASLDTASPLYAKVANNRLLFPVGRFSTWLTSREIAEADRRGHLLSVKQIHLYEKHNIFKEYVEFFYQARRRYKAEGQDTFAYMSKLLLNSLYGKFGQKNEEWEKVGEDEDAPDGVERIYDIQAHEWSRYRTINGLIEQATGYSEGYNSFPAIAAHITADARLELWRIIEAAGVGNVYYCDTDSVFVNEAGRAALASQVDEGRLGALGEKGSAELLRIYGPKDYVFGSQTVLKGIRPDAREIAPGTYEQIRFEGLRGALVEGDLNTMKVYTVRKHLARNYRKGIVNADGSVSPFVLDEL